MGFKATIGRPRTSEYGQKPSWDPQLSVGIMKLNLPQAISQSHPIHLDFPQIPSKYGC